VREINQPDIVTSAILLFMLLIAVILLANLIGAINVIG